MCHTMHLQPGVAKQPNLELKTRPKQLLGSLPLDIALPARSEVTRLCKDCIRLGCMCLSVSQMAQLTSVNYSCKKFNGLGPGCRARETRFFPENLDFDSED